ncbi:synaptotagmin-10-like [Antedon mediterranea]|uniref:synaptotagmin-10-like n=1 Tax=Antedon mediterranea TaxID=105859 RepID=UPI003AF5D8B7
MSLYVIGVLCGVALGILIITMILLWRGSCHQKKKGEENVTNGENVIIKTGSPMIPAVLDQVSVQPSDATPDNKDAGSACATSDSSGSDYETKIGTVKTNLYPRPELITLTSEKGNRGKVHVKLFYSFDRSDFVVELLEASSLPRMDTFGGSSDPYVKLMLEPYPDRKVKVSTVQKRSLNPVFNETFKFPGTFEDLSSQTLRLKVYDFDKMKRHDIIGEVVIPLADVDISRQVEIWADLEIPSLKQDDLGDILFSLSYLPTAERLTIVVIKGRDLKPMDIDGSSDPFVKVSLMKGGKKVRKKKTTVKRSTCSPVWNEALAFNIPSAELKTNYNLEIQVIDYDLVGKNDIVGYVKVGPDCEDVLGKQHWNEMVQSVRRPVEYWHPLQDR